MISMFLAGAMFTMLVDEIRAGQYYRASVTAVICLANLGCALYAQINQS